MTKPRWWSQTFSQSQGVFQIYFQHEHDSRSRKIHYCPVGTFLIFSTVLVTSLRPHDSSVSLVPDCTVAWLNVLPFAVLYLFFIPLYLFPHQWSISVPLISPACALLFSIWVSVWHIFIHSATPPIWLPWGLWMHYRLSVLGASFKPWNHLLFKVVLPWIPPWAFL